MGSDAGDERVGETVDVVDGRVDVRRGAGRFGDSESPQQGQRRHVAGTDRNPALPDLPTVADTLPGYEITQSWGIVVPAGTPGDVVKRLADEFGKALANAEVHDKILKTGAVPASNDSPAAFNDFMAKERARLGDVITRSKIELKE